MGLTSVSPLHGTSYGMPVFSAIMLRNFRDYLMADSAGPLLPALKAIVGDTHVLTAAADVAPYLTDWRGRYHGQARAVVRPGTTAEVAAVVRCCAENGVPVVPQGGNTGLCGGATPHAASDELLVSLTRLNRVRSIDADNATMTVEAGVPLARVQDAAAQAGFLFPLSLAAEGSCLIGGNLSTNAGGTAVLRYGNARELVLGLEVVLPSGEIWDGLRGLRKDNTGYDLKQLFIGAEGTLGVITAAALQLFPLPKSRATAVVALENPESALELLKRTLEEGGERLTGFELFSDFCLSLVLKHFKDAAAPFTRRFPHYVLMELSDTRSGEAVTGLAEGILGAALEGKGILDAAIAQSDAPPNAFLKVRGFISHAPAPES